MLYRPISFPSLLLLSDSNKKKKREIINILGCPLIKWLIQNILRKLVGHCGETNKQKESLEGLKIVIYNSSNKNMFGNVIEIIHQPNESLRLQILFMMMDFVLS